MLFISTDHGTHNIGRGFSYGPAGLLAPLEDPLENPLFVGHVGLPPLSLRGREGMLAIAF